MRRLPRMLAPVVLFAVLNGCSGDDPTSVPAPTPDGPGLRTTYYTTENGQPRAYEASKDFLAIRFRDLAPDAIETFLEKWELEVEIEPAPQLFGLTVVRTADAFAIAPELWRETHMVEYVGPVFYHGECDGHVIVTIPGNEFIVRGDRTDDEFIATLEEANATIVSERPHDPDRGLYAIPWADAGVLFDLTVAVSSNPVVQYAVPNFLNTLCFGATTLESSDEKATR